MKVLSAALVTLAMLAAGLTGAAPAQADPYPHTVPTTCRATPRPPTGVVSVKHRPAVRFKIAAGSTHPSTKVGYKMTKKGGGLVRTGVRVYRGYSVIWLLNRVPVGKYTVKFKTQFSADSVYKNCSTKFTMKVVKP